MNFLNKLFGLPDKNNKRVICADCNNFIPAKNNGAWFTAPMCDFLSHESIDFISGKRNKVYVTCKTLNLNGRCKHFVKDEQLSKTVLKSDVAEAIKN